MVQNQSYEQNQYPIDLVIDFTQTYDSINRLYRAMKKLKVLIKLISLTKINLTDTQNKVAAVGKISNCVRVKTPMSQGDLLPMVLFNLALEIVFRNGETQT